MPAERAEEPRTAPAPPAARSDEDDRTRREWEIYHVVRKSVIILLKLLDLQRISIAT